MIIKIKHIGGPNDGQTEEHEVTDGTSLDGEIIPCAIHLPSGVNSFARSRFEKTETEGLYLAHFIPA